jgi:hypothetical protein
MTSLCGGLNTYLENALCIESPRTLAAALRQLSQPGSGVPLIQVNTICLYLNRYRTKHHGNLEFKPIFSEEKYFLKTRRTDSSYSPPVMKIVEISRTDCHLHVLIHVFHIGISTSAFQPPVYFPRCCYYNSVSSRCVSLSCAASSLPLAQIENCSRIILGFRFGSACSAN